MTRSVDRRRKACEQNITLAYGHENHLTGISGSGISATYVYDGDGKRVAATVGSTTTIYPSASLWAGIGNIYERDNGTGGFMGAHMRHL